MPTSTIWRRSLDPAASRGASPVRPLDEHIERLSPDPIFESRAYDTAIPLSTSPNNGHSIRGLGLSDIGGLVGDETAEQPDHLYYDQHGSAHIAGKIRGRAAKHNGRSRIPSQDYTSKALGKGHTRSGSTIDDLATAAIATSPALVNASPLFVPKATPHAAARAATSNATRRYSHNDYSNGPPAKRIKSERIPTLEWSPRPDRPKTSGGYSSAAAAEMNEDALLLLSLKNELNFKKIANTPKLDTLPEHQQSTSPTSPQATPGPWTMYTSAAGQSQPSPTNEPSIVEAQGGHVEVSISDLDDSIHQQAPFPPRDIALAAPEDTETHAPVHTLPPVVDAPLEPTSGSLDPPPKKRRRVEVETQAEACAKCGRMQLDNVDDEENASTFWISCNFCKRWFHAQCVGLTKGEARSVDKYSCKDCEPVHGPTTYVRKSARPRTAIDYAGLNQGLVKSSEETYTHHYIQRIKEGKLNIQSDDFARIRPELVTKEFMESFEGFRRPFVVPAAWNPRFGAKIPSEPSGPDSDVALKDSTPDTLITSAGEEAGLDSAAPLRLEEEEVINCEQDLLDMVIPQHLTVRRVAEMYGLDEPVPVIDVKSQETKGHWTLQRWADYYEQPGEKPIHNVISLEVSHSPLGRLIRRPRVVRDLDLDDDVWDPDAETRTKKRPVSFYCLMSIADSYTDFHIDFGGSSVYYHILKGTKTFFFIPPEDRYLKKYEDWCNSDSQNETWLGDLCNCTRVDLHEGDTAFIPAGWIHSVWTPEDSLVIGGNFLTRQDYAMQLKIVNIEKVTHVAPKFRYPFFQKVMWYTLIKYLKEDPVPEEVLEDFRDDPDYVFLRADPIWHEVDIADNTAEPGEAFYNARYYPKSEMEGLPALRDYLYRTARIDAGLPVPDITKKQIDAVKASIPKGHGDSMTLIKLFAVWCAWKIGNTPAPEWVFHWEDVLEADKLEKIRKPEALRLPGERTSSRNAAKAQAQAEAEARAQAQAGSQTRPPPERRSQSPAAKPKGHGLKAACEPCRKRRIKCKHKAGSETPRRTPEIRPRSFSNTDVHPLSGAGAYTNGTHARPVSPEARISDAAGAEASQSDPQSSSKKSRSKACEDCRKSKRRCVHDQYGRIDPAKVAEPSKPRGSSSVKRARLSDESRQSGNLDDLIDPALTNGDLSLMTNDASDEDFHTPGPFKGAGQVHHNIQADENMPMTNGVDSETVLIDPALEEGAAIKSEEDPSTIMVSSVTANHDEHISTPSTIRNGSMVNGDFSAPFGWTPGSRQSSRQPKQIERYTPEEKRSPSKPFPKSLTDRRASSAASAHTVVTSIKSERSSSNTSGTTHQMAGILTSRRSASREASARPVSRGSIGGESDVDADERLARELQAAENGLRRRTSMRA